MSAADLSLVEINEAFAAVGVVSMKQLGLSEGIVNVNGGAIPIGASGVVARMISLVERQPGAAGCG